MGGHGDVAPPQYFQIFKEVGQKLARQAARGLATVFSMTFFFSNNLVTTVGQLVRMPPSEGALAHHCLYMYVYVALSNPC